MGCETSPKSALLWIRVYQRLSCWAAYDLFLLENISEKLLFCDLDAVDTFQHAHIQQWLCCTLLLHTAIDLSNCWMNTLHSAPFFNKQCIYHSEHQNINCIYLVYVYTLNDCYNHSTVLPCSCHTSVTNDCYPYCHITDYRWGLDW
jgi:hypothetical protein